jgi:hypothetical protein
MHPLWRVALFLLPSLQASTALAREAPAGMTQFNQTCPAERVAREFDRAYHQCRNGYENGSCQRFVVLFKELLPEYDCQRPFDKANGKVYIVPAIWMLGDAEHEDYVELLSKMKQPQAQALFASKEFRATLDAALAERFWRQSERREKLLKKSPPPK